MNDYTYEGLRRVTYGDKWFIPVCPKCGRFVKSDDTIAVNGEGDYVRAENATCAKCGRVEMPFEGYFEAEGVV